MTRHTTFTYTLAPTSSQAEALRKHVGAARFAFNQCLRFVTDALTAKKEGDAVRVPWSGFDFINAFNAWKLTAAAGTGADGQPGLPWRAEVCQQVFEEGAVDLGSALAAFTAGRKGVRRGMAARFPRFKKKATDRASFRIRNKGVGDRSGIRVGLGAARSIRLPKLGELVVRESTRPLRRMIRSGRAKILFATVSHCSRCGNEADRDVNAAKNLAGYVALAASQPWPRVAAKHAETINACGEGSAGARLIAERETPLVEAGRASAQRPRRAVSTRTVNTL